MTREKIVEVWQSKEAMAEAYKEMLHLSSFDQTKDAARLVARIMAHVLEDDHFTYYDVRCWVQANVTDFNVASQILLNCQRGFLLFDLEGMKAKVATLEAQFKDSMEADNSPFRKKAKFIDGDDAHNGALSEIRNLRLLAGSVGGTNSYRISPFGKTPALADSNNWTSLSLSGLASYCKNSAIWILNLPKILEHIHLRTQEDGSIMADGLVYPIRSESGGNLVDKALASRWVATQALYEDLDLYIVPKYESLLVVGGDLPSSLQPYVSRY